MAKIKLLDPEAVSKIAAGEVIERPASVVKELVENSIDAGATKILVEVVDGGKSLIRVTDDGSGMDRQDASIAFEKHATSKISDASDLERISTLGFRGEALSSIASVAKSVDLVTKAKSSGVGVPGTHVRVEGGRVVEVGDVGAPAGTTVEVRGLFGEIPARRKYLKSGRAELARIAGVVTSYAVICHRISFELFSGDRTVFKSVRSESWNDPILRILGRDVARNLVSIEGESKSVSVTGSVGRETATRSSPDWIMIYVNGRLVRSRALTRAVAEGYRTLIPTGRHPVAVVSIRIDPAMVDANVHPAKTEVRFLKEEEVAAMVTDAIRAALTKAGGGVPPPQTVEGPAQTDLFVSGVGTEVSAPGPEAAGPVSSGEAGKGGGYDLGGGFVSDLQKTLPLYSGKGRLDLEIEAEPLPGGLRILGQAHTLYIVAEGPGGLVLVDQHAAAERVRYESLKKKYDAGTISQELIVPVTLELSPKEAVLLEEWGSTLAEMGFDVQPFGGNAYAVRAVPAIGVRLERTEAVHDVLRDLFALGRVGTEATAREEILKLLACRGSIKAGHDMGWKEMHDLLRGLFATDNPRTCPHGRPTVVILSIAELEKIFGRR
jgi:DNA mismatch repair protein MutL